MTTSKANTAFARGPDLLLAMLASCSLHACVGPQADVGPEEREVGRTEQALYANKDYYWSGDPVMIPVCWENASAATSTRRNWVREVIESNWARYARVNFVEWGNCTSGQAGVHIKIADVRSAAPGGVNLDGVDDGVTLNLSFDNYGPAWCRTSAANRKHCVQATALHEFGHVLGFYHEEERPDYSEPPGTQAGDDCEEQTFANSNEQYYGAYDIDSVMSYCGQPFDDPATWKVSLSPGDIAAVQRAYGRRIAGSVVSPRADCLSNHASARNGERSFIWDCDEAADDQEWLFDGAHLYLAPNRCLENEYWSNESGDDTLIWNCGSYSTQDWAFERIEVRGWGGLCLDLHNGDTTPWTNIQMWECNGSSNQQWTITESGQIKFGGPNSNSCATAYAGNVFIYSCDYPIYQEFEFRTGGEIRLKNLPDLCLDVQGWWDSSYLDGNGRPFNGENVQLFSCTSPQMNQKWNFSGQIHHSDTGLCLDRRNNNSANGTATQIWSCNTTSAQVWDYYFK